MRWLYRVLCCIAWPFFNLYHSTGVIGKENIPEGGALICSNHCALSDPLFVVFAFGLRYHLKIMAKAELLRVPVLGFLLKKSGIFGVERGKSDVAAIKTALSSLKKGQYVLMFPEGTRVKDRQTSEAKTGAAMLAVRAGVPVLPVYVPEKKGFLRHVKVVIGEPYKMETQGKKATPEDYRVLSDELMEKIYALGETKV